MDSTLLILALSAAAAAAAGLGALPLMGRRELHDSRLGWANALAAGMMFGAAYLLTSVQPEGSAVEAAMGAALGVIFILATHRVAGTENQTLNCMREDNPAYGY